MKNNIHLIFRLIFSFQKCVEQLLSGDYKKRDYLLICHHTVFKLKTKAKFKMHLYE
jgi:hypothetical protein